MEMMHDFGKTRQIFQQLEITSALLLVFFTVMNYSVLMTLIVATTKIMFSFFSLNLERKQHTIVDNLFLSLFYFFPIDKFVYIEQPNLD